MKFCVRIKDAAALEHNKQYRQFLKEGKNPYIVYNSADEQLLNTLKEDTSFVVNLATVYFRAKKCLLTPLG